MPRDIPIGNGSLQVNFDSDYQIRDIYWPHVGQENHAGGHAFRFGVWADGSFRWTSDPGWETSLTYLPGTLVTHVTLRHPDLGLRLVCHDVVDFHEQLYIREITVHNERDAKREVRLFFGQDFHIGGHPIGDTAYYEPERRAVFHYKGKRWFLVNAAKASGDDVAIGVDEWAIGEKETRGKEGAWRDAEDGALSGNAVAQGSVDSAVGLHLELPPNGEARGWYWICVGEDFDQARLVNRAVRAKGPAEFIKRTRDYWSLWATKEDEDCPGLPEPIAELYRRSLLVLRTQIDEGGAIIASTDWEMARYASDSYGYMWPRDGALMVRTLIDAGYSAAAQRFFGFCKRAITDRGYLLHKYNPDGSLGSSWHGWLHQGEKQLPIQEDETALVLWALWRHFERFRIIELIKPLYRGVIIRAGDWMADYRDPETGLPRESWDLWEERRGVPGWTVGATWAGLQAAAKFAEAFGETDAAEGYRSAASEVKSGVEQHLWADDLGRYVRMINRDESGAWQRDETIDASLFGLWYFGMFEPDEPRIVATMEAVRERLWVKTDVGGIARYENDYYHQVSDDIEAVPGNPWFICTLWLAQWHIAKAKALSDLEPALELLEWCPAKALESGVMAEQVHPHTGEPLSVSPLTWSHATFVQTVRDYVAKRSELGG